MYCLVVVSNVARARG
jgi:hypothetical protein